MAGLIGKEDIEDTLARVAGIMAVGRSELDKRPEGLLLRDLVRDMANNGHDKDGPIRDTFARIGDKWCMLLLLILRSGPFHYAALRRLVNTLSAEGAISQRMLTLRLRSLERNGFISRAEDVSTSLRRVEYTLTPLGRELTGQAFALINWIGSHKAEIEAARREFDRREKLDGWF